MRKGIILATAFFISLVAWAETPKECYAKHGDRLAIFVNTEPLLSNMENFNIERVAIDQTVKHVYIKTIQNDDDIVYEVEEMKKPSGYVMMLKLEGGRILAIDDDLQVAFGDDEGKASLYRYHNDKTTELRKLQSK